MPNATIQAAAEGMANTTRRNLLIGLATTLTAAAVVIGPKAHAADPEVEIQAENPELIAAYTRFTDARSELAEAKDALEWLADEWKHLWPLAPEEMLMGANAQDGRYSTLPAERDIIGRYIMRDKSELTKRLSPKFRQEGGRTCFSLATSAQEMELLERWKKRKITGRTEKALARNQALANKSIKEGEVRIKLAEQYEAETASLRKLSGVEAAQQRIEEITASVLRAADDISFLPALTAIGLCMKADALETTAGKILELTIDECSGLGHIARFVKSVRQVSEAAA